MDEEPKGGKEREDGDARARDDTRTVRAKKEGQGAAPVRGAEAKASADKVVVTKKDKDESKEESKVGARDDKGDEAKDAARKEEKRDARKVGPRLDVCLESSAPMPYAQQDESMGRGSLLPRVLQPLCARRPCPCGVLCRLASWLPRPSLAVR